MTDRVLDIWAIQNHPEEIYDALEHITKDVVIFKHLICKFKIGYKLISFCLYDNVIYSEDSDTLIMLKRGGKASVEQAEQYFDEHGIEYHVVDFMPIEQFQTSGSEKEFWFVRDAHVLEDAVKDSIQKGNYSCRFAECVKSNLIFKYPNTITPQINENDSFDKCYLTDEILLQISFKRLIEFDDKYILPTLSSCQWNLHTQDILNVLNKYNVDVNYDNDLNNYSLNFGKKSDILGFDD